MKNKIVSKQLLYALFLPLILFHFPSFSQTNLRFKDKVKIRRELKVMLKKDQKYRSEISRNEHSTIELDALWELQNALDSSNMIEFISLIRNYGYPSLKRVGTQISYVLILHFTRESDFYMLNELFFSELKIENMPNTEFAMWYDRCMLLSKNPVKYGAYGQLSFCGNELLQINKNRKEIGLKALLEVCN